MNSLIEALREAERFMAYFSGETFGSFEGSGTPQTCLAQIRAALATVPEVGGRAMNGYRALAEELREYTAMKYAGDCKCGKCQLVPRALVERIYHTLNSIPTQPQTAPLTEAQMIKAGDELEDAAKAIFDVLSPGVAYTAEDAFWYRRAAHACLALSRPKHSPEMDSYHKPGCQYDRGECSCSHPSHHHSGAARE